MQDKIFIITKPKRKDETPLDEEEFFLRTESSLLQYLKIIDKIILMADIAIETIDKTKI